MVERVHIGFFGRMNAGKSSLMNLITQQETSIVDSYAGTTADSKITLSEIHGLGPVKLFDTAGVDEKSDLGEKKRAKTDSVLKECNVVVIVIDSCSSSITSEMKLIASADKLNKNIFIVYNRFKALDLQSSEDRANHSLLRERLERYKSIEIDVLDSRSRDLILKFFVDNIDSKNSKVALIPNVVKDKFYILIIPMDEETPDGRLLRPQSMVLEYILRRGAFPVAYRMDLTKARKGDVDEHIRFNSFISSLGESIELVITDSQAIDIVGVWLSSDIKVTTFSIVMVNYLSRGRILDFYRGAEVIDRLLPKDRVLIVEACNHSRVAEDIGTVQIPTILERLAPDVTIEHNFGREFYENDKLQEYALIIHCGGCMISSQKMGARLVDLDNIGVPYTNYGLFLAAAQGAATIDRVMTPWITV